MIVKVGDWVKWKYVQGSAFAEVVNLNVGQRSIMVRERGTHYNVLREAILEVRQAGQAQAKDVEYKLRSACLMAGGQKPFAMKHKMSTAYVNDVLRGRRYAGEKILKALGIVKVISYRKAKP